MAEQQSITDYLLELQQGQLDAIGVGDYDAYADSCSKGITCFEPEAAGHLVEGMEFHKVYFVTKGMAPGPSTLRNTMSRPQVQLLGGEENPAAAIISYVRLVQYKCEAGKHGTKATQETRVWERIRAPWAGQPWGEWKCVHLHRSPA